MTDWRTDRHRCGLYARMNISDWSLPCLALVLLFISQRVSLSSSWYTSSWEKFGDSNIALLDCRNSSSQIFRNIVEKKWSYWDSYWSFVEWTIILTSISAVGFYLYKVDKSAWPLFVKVLKNGSKCDCCDGLFDFTKHGAFSIFCRHYKTNPLLILNPTIHDFKRILIWVFSFSHFFSFTFVELNRFCDFPLSFSSTFVSKGIEPKKK